MNVKVIKSTVFIIWLMAIAVSSVIPYAKNDGMLSLKLTESGMVLHFVGYFVVAALFYWAYRKDTLFSILFSCFSIFMFSVALEVVQFYLPYRSFNPVDIAANGFGILFFVICWAVFFRSGKVELGNRKEEIGPPQRNRLRIPQGNQITPLR